MIDDDEYEEELLVEEDIPDLKEILCPKELKKQKRRETAAMDYINKETMWQAFKSYYEASAINKNIPIPLDLANMVNDIVNNMSHMPNFNGYADNSNWLVDMIGDAKVKVFKAIVDQSFVLFTVVNILTETNVEGVRTIYYLNRKAKKKQLSSEKSLLFDTLDECRTAIVGDMIKRGEKIVVKNPFDNNIYYVVGTRIFEPDQDVIDQEKNTLTFKANPFGFYSQIVYHCFINRIKKNQQAQKTVKAFQEETYENMYASKTWENVRRQKVFYDDDGGFTDEN